MPSPQGPLPFVQHSPAAVGDVNSLPSGEWTSPVLQTEKRPEERPQVDSVRDLHTLCDVHAVDDVDGVDRIVFLRSTFSFIDDQDKVYFGQAPIRRTLLSLQDLKKGLKRVLDKNVYPETSAQITALAGPPGRDCYVKRPKLTNYEDLEGTGQLQKLFLDEAKTLELLKRNPHPNIVQYHGCIVRRGHITGIVLQRYPITLANRLREGAQAFQKDVCIERIESGAKHLHSLGLAHNDLNPSNIMLDKHENPIIIDLGSCRPFGDTLITGGTRGWVEADFTTSEQRHDEIALDKIRVWLWEK